VFIAWLFVIFFILLPLQPDLTTWHHMANALARYFIGFPGGLLAAFGLRRQALERIAPLNVPHIVNTLRMGGLALAFYALLAGLIPPAVPFWPGNLLNTTTFEQTFSVPPLVFRSLIGLVLAIAIIRALEVFEVETARLIEAMEQQQILAAERDRLGRDLHDGAIQTVYTAGLLVESARHLVPDDSPAAPRLEKALIVLNDAIGDLRRNLGELRATPSGPAAQLLGPALQQLAADPSFSSLLDIKLALDLPADESPSAVRTDHVLAIVREALANAVRHARASRVSIAAGRADGRLLVSIKDNGIGLPPGGPAGYGLRNMRDRARLLDGTLEIAGAPGKGVAVELNVPWADER
jgi:signal transduction histidine kinase